PELHAGRPRPEPNDVSLRDAVDEGELFLEGGGGVDPAGLAPTRRACGVPRSAGGDHRSSTPVRSHFRRRRRAWPPRSRRPRRGRGLPPRRLGGGAAGQGGSARPPEPGGPIHSARRAGTRTRLRQRHAAGSIGTLIVILTEGRMSGCRTVQDSRLVVVTRKWHAD